MTVKQMAEVASEIYQGKMKEYKIDLSGYEGKVREVVSKAIQRHAFKLGYEWCGSVRKVTPTNSPYLFFNKDRYITHVGAEDVRYFESHKNAKISAADFLAITPEDVKGAPKEPEFKPFDRVLVRDFDNSVWIPHFYSHRDENLGFIHRTIGGVGYQQCIPYEWNEHLLGTTEDVK